MAITISDLATNLKDLRDVRVAINFAYLNVEQAFVPVSELDITMLVEFALRSLNIAISPESSAAPILLIQIKIGRTEVANAFRIGASLSVRERVLLPRTFVWPMPPPLAAPMNTWADTWATDCTASLQLASAANNQVRLDVGRLLGEFMKDWKSVN